VGAFLFFAMIHFQYMNAGAITLTKLVDYVLQPLMVLIFSIGFLVFIWGLVEFLRKSADANKVEGKQHMLWGLIGMLIMVSITTIISLIDETFDLNLREGGAGTGIQRNVSAPPSFAPSEYGFE